MRFAAAALESPGVWSLAVRILVAAALGGLVGFEREYRGQPAGFRTHILVAVGAALFTLAGVAAAGSSGNVDPTRVAAQVVTGIGFLGAGAIIQQGISIHGLTTAATLWVVAAIGTAAGLGYYSGALVAAGTTVVSLVVFKRLELVLFPGTVASGDLVLEVAPSFRLGDVTAAIRQAGGRVLATRVGTRDGGVEMHVSVRLGRASYEELLQALLRVDGVRHVHWSH